MTDVLVDNVLKKEVKGKDRGLTWTTFPAIYQSDIVKSCNIFLRKILFSWKYVNLLTKINVFYR
jgi:hypothetical protein